MSLLGSQVYANPSTPLWLSSGGGAVSGSLTVKDDLNVVPSVTSGSSTIALGPQPSGDYPYTSLIESTPVDILTSLGSELRFYTRENILATPPTLAMTIDSTQNVTMTGGLTVDEVATNKLILPTTGAGPTAGTASIPAGNDNVVVNTTAVTADSIILTTRMGNASAGPGIGTGQHIIMVQSTQIVPGVSFEAFLVDAITGIKIAADTVSADFSWVIIN